MLNTTVVTSGEIIKPVVIVEDSSYCANRHRERFEHENIPTLYVRSVGELLQLLDHQTPIRSIVTDGLHGDWESVVKASREARLPVTVVSGERSIIDAAKNIYCVPAFLKSVVDDPKFAYSLLINE